MRGGNVEEADLVRPLVAVFPGDLDGVTGVPQVKKIYALHDPPVLYVEAGDYSLG